MFEHVCIIYKGAAIRPHTRTHTFTVGIGYFGSLSFIVREAQVLKAGSAAEEMFSVCHGGGVRPSVYTLFV